MYFPSNESHLQITLSFFAFEKPTPSTKTDIESTSSINSRNTKPNIETVQKNLIFDSPDIQIINENFISNSRSNKEDHISHHQSEMASKNDGQHTKQYLFQKEDNTSSLIKGSSYPPPIPVNPPPSITTSTLKVFKESIEERKTFSTMSTAARLLEEATVSEKRWSSQPERVVEGTPPKPVSLPFDSKIRV
uniref:Uncharacterized protein n=1 Tax=Rhabditophanes sp. KR3021 TaxID=114890 RepID=A0AC35TS77_9BILA